MKWGLKAMVFETQPIYTWELEPYLRKWFKNHYIKEKNELIFILSS